MIVIVDYGMGNLRSVQHALEALGADVRIASSPKELEGAERLVLPGVGAFGDCMRNLNERGFVDALDQLVLRDRLPILGVCLGMQVMARRGHEGGIKEGLGWIDAEVVKLEPANPRQRVPHIGWNNVAFHDGSPLFAGVPRGAEFYFVHSYHLRCTDTGIVDATCDFAGPVTAAIRKDNIFATQFHPEKSQDHGLKMISNFLDWTPR